MQRLGTWRPLIRGEPSRGESTPVEVLAVDVARRHSGLAESLCEALDHRGRAAEKDRHPGRGSRCARQDVVGGDAAIGAAVAEVDTKVGVSGSDLGDLGGERGGSIGAVVEVDLGRKWMALQRPEPAQKWRDTDPASDPDLVAGAAGVLEPAVGSADDSRHAGLDEVLKLAGVVAERLDGESQDSVVGGP
jgi:hypothetical protein